jgi:hypothetical protein
MMINHGWRVPSGAGRGSSNYQDMHLNSVATGGLMSIEQEELAALAMNFAHEVLDWPNAVFHVEQPNRLILKQEYVGNPSEMWGYDFGRIDDVFPIVRQWCQEHPGVGFSLRFTSRGGYVVTIQDESAATPNILIESAESEDVTYALIWACLEASRKLREAA